MISIGSASALHSKGDNAAILIETLQKFLVTVSRFLLIMSVNSTYRLKFLPEFKNGLLPIWD